MTQVKDKTDKQLNQALAELMGYTVNDLDSEWWRSKHYWVLKEPNEERQSIGRDTEDEAWEDAPNYCTDPAASLEVQAKAIEVDYKAYLRNMQMLRWNRSSSRLSLWDAANLMLASPRERAEAADITLSSVKE
jgi:hypothetical protein